MVDSPDSKSAQNEAPPHFTTMEANSGRETSFSPVQFDPAEMDHLLRRKRKAREFKACYPCRQRKVKCDQGVPCKTCIGVLAPRGVGFFV